MALFTYAYAPYNIAIAVATAGVPLAASKYVAKYNAIGAYKVSQKFYKSSFIVMSITGVLGFLVLYFLAPYISELTLARNVHDKMVGQLMTLHGLLESLVWLLSLYLY